MQVKKGVGDCFHKNSAVQSLDNYGSNGYPNKNNVEIAVAQMKPYNEKIQWFQDTCAQLYVEWNEGHLRMNVRHDFLLSDSMEAVMSLSRKNLRKVWRFEFIGEQGIDAGGVGEGVV